MSSEHKDLIVATVTRKIGYLSAAPRVSTDVVSEASGPRAHVLGVIRAFETLGWKVYPYIVGDRMPRKLISQSEGLLEKSFVFRLGADLIRMMMGLWHSIRAGWELNGKVDWVYERFAVLQALGWIFHRQSVPWILETNGLFFYEAKTERKSILLAGIARILEFWAYRHCDVLVCVTEALKDLVVECAEIPPEKVIVVPNGVDTTRFNPDRYTPKRVLDGPTLGFVGTLVDWHRLDLLLMAIADLRREKIDFRLVVLGDGPMQKAWESKVQELDLHDCTRFVGRVSWNEIPRYIAGFDIGYVGNNPLEIGVMYHSPLKLYEYMAMERPVIASAYVDARAVITHGENGYLFEPGDTEDLKRVLRLAYEHKARWPEMGKSARASVLRQASWQARVHSMISEIERILEKPDARRFA